MFFGQPLQWLITYRVSFLGKTAITTFKIIQNVKLGVFWKIQNICHQMGTEIFKIEEEMTLGFIFSVISSSILWPFFQERTFFRHPVH